MQDVNNYYISDQEISSLANSHNPFEDTQKSNPVAYAFGTNLASLLQNLIPNPKLGLLDDAARGIKGFVSSKFDDLVAQIKKVSAATGKSCDDIVRLVASTTSKSTDDIKKALAGATNKAETISPKRLPVFPAAVMMLPKHLLGRAIMPVMWQQVRPTILTPG